MNRSSVGALCALGIAALALAGCGSSKSSTTAASQQSSATTSSATTEQASGTPAPAAAAGTVVTVKHSGDLGTIVAAGTKKLTVYMFGGDKGSQSACAGGCIGVWPPVTTSASPTAQGGAHASDLGTITRSNGVKQVTYNGHPLYFYASDKDAGDAYGQGLSSFGSDWYVISPSGSKVDNS